MNLYAITLQYVQQGFSIIPLRGGDDPEVGKQPALPSWLEFKTRRPTAAELHHWFVEEGYTAYGMVGGGISHAVFLDEDVVGTVAALAQQVPAALLNTRQIRSGFRGGLHLYWRTTFPVSGRLVIGGELRGEGQYVVGEGSWIAGKVWAVVMDRPIRPISQPELGIILKCLEIPPTASTSYPMPAAIAQAAAKQRPPTEPASTWLEKMASWPKTQM